MRGIERNRKQALAWGSVIVLIGILAGIGYFDVMVATVNDATRADLSKHVSNRTCGGLQGEEDPCPGELECVGGQGSRGVFDMGRVGANFTEGRCATPMYKERYCGIFEANIVMQTYPPKMGECQPYTGWHGIGPADYVDALLEASLYDRIFNTGRNGEERIRKHGLKLAKEEYAAER